MNLKVQTYSGYKADERPISFTLDNEDYFIEEIIYRWFGEDFDYFKVKVTDGNHFLLKRNRLKNEWEINII